MSSVEMKAFCGGTGSDRVRCAGGGHNPIGLGTDGCLCEDRSHKYTLMSQYVKLPLGRSKGILILSWWLGSQNPCIHEDGPGIY